MVSSRSWCAALLVVCLIVLSGTASEARPPHRRPVQYLHDQDLAASFTDQRSAASGGHDGRVQIKVYRGPGDMEHTPHGYWVKQPSDDSTLFMSPSQQHQQKHVSLS